MMVNIVKKINDAKSYRQSFGHEPRYIYLGESEIKELMDYLCSNPNYSSSSSVKIFHGLEVIEVKQESHLVVF